MNKDIALAFASRFDPPLNVVATQNINGVPAKDGFMCAYHDKARKIGVTFVVFGDGHYQAYLECTGQGDATKAADSILAGLTK